MRNGKIMQVSMTRCRIPVEKCARNFLYTIRFLLQPQPQDHLDENRVEGTVRNGGGKVQEGFGRVAGDARARADGLAN
jgi:hypothetical protein